MNKNFKKIILKISDWNEDGRVSIKVLGPTLVVQN